MSKNNEIKQKDIHNAAWSACDTFRGVMEPAAYKDYILVMLFLKDCATKSCISPNIFS
jgi:type I restriction-modification system DNA methylase subunit